MSIKDPLSHPLNGGSWDIEIRQRERCFWRKALAGIACITWAGAATYFSHVQGCAWPATWSGGKTDWNGMKYTGRPFFAGLKSWLLGQIKTPCRGLALACLGERENQLPRCLSLRGGLARLEVHWSTQLHETWPSGPRKRVYGVSLVFGMGLVLGRRA